jgi:DNA-binding response OmpR family regulator/two-component sensor histidine kinase
METSLAGGVVSPDHSRPELLLSGAGVLSADIVHDLNNLLTVLNSCNEMLLTSCELPEKALRCVHAARDAGQRATSLARAMMVINRTMPPELSRVDVNESVKELLALGQSLLPANVELATDLAPGLHAVLADRSGILQLLLNLVLNARDAMPEGGKVEISTTSLQSEAASSIPRPLLPEGDFIVLTVADSGTGIDEATRQRIFEPFYTTKPAGRGTGLGLFTVQQVVKRCGGFLSISSAKGLGTTVRIYLPAAAGEAQTGRAQSVQASAAIKGGGETILIVEDDAELRNLMRELLEGAGYAVLDAGSASEAVEMSRGLNDAIDLLVADVVLRDSQGKELADCLHESRPGLAVLYISGYPAYAASDAGLAPAADFLAKPFTVAELTGSIRSILDRQKRKRILIVDDEPMVLLFASETLKEAGYDVLVAEDGSAVASIVESEPLDLVITDLVMREREGFETMMHLRKSNPDLPVVVISGAFSGHFLRSASIMGARATLAKPFSGEDLLNTVRTVLGE